MDGFVPMVVVVVTLLYLLLGRALPAMLFQYRGRGERRARAEHVRIRRDNPDSPDARLTEPEFIEKFLREGPHPWRYVLASGVLALLGLPGSCLIAATRSLR